MSYRIVHPVAMPIDANNFRDAVKKFIKLNHFMNIEQIILSDQYNHMKANVKYYDNNNRRKASIQLIPIDTASVPSYVGFSSTNPNAPYPTAGFAVGPSMIGGPAGIIAPAGPVMVERPAMIGGPIIGGPMIGMPGGPMIGMPGGPGVAGVIVGPTPTLSDRTSDEIIRIDEINMKIIAITKVGSTFPVLKIEKISDNQCRVYGPSGRMSIIKTEIIEDGGKRTVFENKKFKPEDEEVMFDLTNIINKTASVSVPQSASSMMMGPTHVITPSKQILPIAPRVGIVGTDGRPPASGVVVPFGRGIVSGVGPSFGRAGVIGMTGGPGVVVGGPMGTPVRFGRGVF
jgi:hypothetical protein